MCANVFVHSAKQQHKHGPEKSVCKLRNDRCYRFAPNALSGSIRECNFIDNFVNELMLLEVNISDLLGRTSGF